MLKKVLVGVAVIMAGFLIYVGSQPDSYEVERSTRIAAPAEVIFDQVDDLRSFNAWSPWGALDPNMKKTFSGPESGVVSVYEWQGNDDVGAGKMEIIDATAPTHVAYRLTFIEPFAGTAETAFDLDAEGDDGTSVTWSMTGSNDFMAKLVGVFVDFEGMIGADYEKGLADLRALAEKEAAKRAEERAAAAEEVTLAGTMMCGKCALEAADSCQNVLVVGEGDEQVQYWLVHDALAKAHHDPVCEQKKSATVVGSVEDSNGKKMLAASEITYE